MVIRIIVIIVIITIITIMMHTLAKGFEYTLQTKVTALPSAACTQGLSMYTSGGSEQKINWIGWMDGWISGLVG